MKAIWIVTVTATRHNVTNDSYFSTTAANVFATETDAINYRADQRKAWYKDNSIEMLDNVVHVDSSMERLPIDPEKLVDFERKFNVTVEREVTLHKVYQITAENQDEAHDQAEEMAEYDDWFDEGYDVEVHDSDTCIYDSEEVEDFD